ncbi:MAG: ribonuclease P protein component [Bacteroidetes bacterium]|nr:ribonuclease P protein component [Bacteroidota bacterium]
MASFSKNERLTGARNTGLLFDKGSSSFRVFPLLYIVRPMNFTDGANCKSLISVSKRRFKKAVDRNLLKRRIRAVHQENKEQFYHLLADGESVALGILYNTSEICDYRTLEKSYQKFLRKYAETRAQIH